MQTIGDRFSIALDAIYGSSSTKKCVDDLEVSQSTIDRGKKGDSLTKTISLFAAKNNISTSWLLTGKGMMYIEKQISSINQSGNNNNQLVGNGHIVQRCENISETDREIMDLLKYAGEPFKQNLIDKLKKFKVDSEI